MRLFGHMIMEAEHEQNGQLKHDNILFYVKNPKSYIFNTDEINKEPYMAPGLLVLKRRRTGKIPTDTWWASFYWYR